MDPHPQKQPWKQLKENSSLTTSTTHTRSDKASIGVTLSFSKRNWKLNYSPQREGDNVPSPFNFNAKNISEVPRSNPEELAPPNVEEQAGHLGRNSKVFPLKPQVIPPARAERLQQHIIYPETVQSTKRVEEVYANRKSGGNGCVVEEDRFAATRQTNFVKYERRKNINKQQVVGELCIQRSQHVKFNFERSHSEPHHSSPSPLPRQKRNKSKDNYSETALRMKLRNALGLLNSSPSEKQDEEEAPRAPNEPKSDSIETDSQEAQQIAKPLQGGRGRGGPNLNPNSLLERDKRKISPRPPAVTHIFSFNQDEDKDDAMNFSSKFKRKFRPPLPDTDTGLNVLLQTSREKIIDKSPANTVMKEQMQMQIQNHHSPTPAIAATTTSSESPVASSLVPNGDTLIAQDKEELQLLTEKDAGIGRSSTTLRRNGVTEANTSRQRLLKRKSPESASFAYLSKQSHTKCMAESEDGSDDSSEIFGAVKQLAGILAKFKGKLKMEVDRKATQILSSSSHNIHIQVERIQSQIQSDMWVACHHYHHFQFLHTYFFCNNILVEIGRVKYANLGKAKQRQWEANVQDQNEKLRVIHEKFKKDLAEHAQSCRIVLSQIEGEEMELKSIAERQKVSHKKLASQMQQIMESDLGDAQRKITALLKAARNSMQALK
ncbi:hypothetical protein KI387_020189, partial [Taxus chinensis]